jgi:anaphase-promoting complex subunit 2
LQDLSQRTKVPTDILKKRIGFWLNNGILKEVDKNVFQLLESPLDNVVGQAFEEEDTATSTANEQQEEELKVYESFVVGMLKTFTTLTADKVHTMLSNYVPTYTLSQQDLNQFLSRLVKEDKLEYKGGQYNLKK